MTKIKVLSKCRRGSAAPYEYAPGYVFTEDSSCTDYDWLVGFEDIPSDRAEVLVCPRERTMFLTWEPVSVKRYSPAFTRQFGHLLTNRPPEADRHPHYHFGRGYFPWFIERDAQEVAAAVLPPKTRLLSTVCSSKQMKQTLHYQRFCLTTALKAAFPDLDWYGHGVKPMDRKIDALDPYKYHIAVENHIAPGHWTEKIADPILCECLTFYAGDPTLGEVLPSESFIPIPIDNPAEAERIIRAAIEEGAYEKRLGAIREAKRRLLEKYNFHAQIIATIEACRDQPVTPVNPARPVKIYARKALRRHNPLVALSDGWHHLVSILKGGR